MQDQPTHITPPSTEEIDKIFQIFRDRAGIDPAGADVATLSYLLSLIRAHPRELMDSSEYSEAVLAMRTLSRIMPKLIDRAERIAGDAQRTGRPTWADRYAMQARAVLAAIEPMNLDRRDKRGWWHGWAQMAEIDIRLIFHRHSQIASFANPTAPAVLVMCDLLALAGHNAPPTAVVDAITK